MGRLNLTGVCEKNGSYYRRFKVKKGGKWKDEYVALPHPSHPTFAAKLARLNQRVTPRTGAAEGTMAALIEAKRKLLPKEKKAESTRRNWRYYLDLIEKEHGKRLVADIRKSHCYKIRDSMTEHPGKANAYMSKLKALLELACERDLIATNPAQGIPKLGGGERDPWPRRVLEDALDLASPMLRLAIITGLFTGQRIGDVIQMRHDWIRDGMMELKSQKTETDTFIPVHPEWAAEMAKVERKDTILHDRFGNAFKDTDRLQARIRRLMKDMGEVDEDGKPLYSFHGLSKNAIAHMVELDLTDEQISTITGKTPETVRYYAKSARRWRIAKRIADTVKAGRPEGYGGKTAENGGKRVAENS